MPATIKVGGTVKSPSRIFGNVSGTFRRLHRGWVNVLGVWRFSWQEEVVATIGSTNGAPVLRNYFDPVDWANPLVLKRAIVPLGNEVGTTNATYAIAPTLSADPANSWAGTLILDIYGTVSGIGGAPNGGQGGSVIWGNLPGRNGEKMIVNNYGTIRAGGGAGGYGGAGGTGYWVNSGSEGPVFNASSPPYYSWSNEGNIYWASYSPLASVGYGPATWFDGSTYTYYRGANTGQGYQISRTWSVNVYTPGGGGGTGGRGQGYDGGWNYGTGGAAGGSNAGAGGSGGQGGGYGSYGANGAAGGYGNWAGWGPAGSAGGPPGYYVHGSANLIFNNFGTVLGLAA